MGLFKRSPPKSKEERRRYLRRSQLLRVSYQVGDGIQHVDCSTKDISEGGIRLNLYQRLTIGTFLELYIYLPAATNPVLLFGKIVWIKETSGSKYPFEAGIEFDFLDSSSRSKIQNYIQSISQK